MGIRYYKLFDLLNRKNMKKSDLRQILSSATIAKLSKGEYISGEAIEKICIFLDCQPGDIMEVIQNESLHSDGTLEYQTKHVNYDFYPGILTTDTLTIMEDTNGTTIIDIDNE